MLCQQLEQEWVNTHILDASSFFFFFFFFSILDIFQFERWSRWLIIVRWWKIILKQAAYLVNLKFDKLPVLRAGCPCYFDKERRFMLTSEMHSIYCQILESLITAIWYFLIKFNFRHVFSKPCRGSRICLQMFSAWPCGEVVGNKVHQMYVKSHYVSISHLLTIALGLNSNNLETGPG